MKKKIKPVAEPNITQQINLDTIPKVSFIRRILLSYLFVSAGMFTFSQFFLSLFNPYRKEELAYKLSIAVAPIDFILFMVLLLIGGGIILAFLRPLYTYFSTSSIAIREQTYPAARIACVKLPIFLIIYHVASWTIGTLIYGLTIDPIKDTDHNPFIVVLLFNMTCGLWQGTTILLAINTILIKPKLYLRITAIHPEKGEREFSIQNQLMLLFVVSVLLGSMLAYIVSVYYIKINTLGGSLIFPDYTVTFLVVALVYIGLIFIIFSLVRWDLTRSVRQVNDTIQSLFTHEFDYSDRVYLIHFNEIGRMITTLNHFIDRVYSVLLRKEKALRNRNAAIEEEIKIARTFQESFLPKDTLDVKSFRIGYRYNPLEGLGGDYFSFVTLKERQDSFGIFIGDVAGHGVSAALYSALIKATTDRIYRKHGFNPTAYLQQLNTELLSNQPAIFLTAIYGFFQYIPYIPHIPPNIPPNHSSQPMSPNSRVSQNNHQHSPQPAHATFTFSRGGHPYPIMYRKKIGQASYLECHGTIIGMLDQINNTEHSVVLEKGDRIYFFTDGIFELFDENRNILGLEPLLEIFSSTYDPDLETTLDQILNQVYNFSEHAVIDDDVLLIGVEYTDPADTTKNPDYSKINEILTED